MFEVNERVVERFSEDLSLYVFDKLDPESSPMASFLEGVRYMMNKMPLSDEENTDRIIRDVAYCLYDLEANTGSIHGISPDERLFWDFDEANY